MAIRKIHQIGERNHKEYTAAGTIKPGHLIQVGSAGTVTVHSTQGGIARILVAQENYLEGKTVDDSYTTGNNVLALAPRKNDTVAFILRPGVAYTPATPLVSYGDGTLCAKSQLPSAGQAAAVVLAFPQVAVDLSAGGAVATLAAVEVL